MALVRETIYAALENKLSILKPGTIITLERFWKSWDRVPAPMQPAIFIPPKEEAPIQEKGSPPILTITLDAFIYAMRGTIENYSAETAINNIMDALDATIAPEAVSGFQTLNGAVAHTWNPGPNSINPAIENEQAVALYPISMLVTGNNLPGQQQMVFDSGYLYAIPRDRPDGSATNKTPIRLGAFKGITLNMAIENVFPDSQFQYKLNASVGNRTITGTAKVGWINGYIWNQIIFGKELEPGNRIASLNESKEIPANPGPYEITVVPPNSGTYNQDLGVVYADNGLALKAVTTPSAAGEYSQSGAVYTFHEDDAEKDIAISYLYDVTSGNKITVDNAFQGYAPSFQLLLVGVYNNKQMTILLNKCITEALTIPGTLEQFYLFDFGFEAIADSTGNVAIISMA